MIHEAKVQFVLYPPGVPAELAAKMCAAKPKLEVTQNADGVTIKTFANDKVFSNTVVFGKDSPTDVAGVKYTVSIVKSFEANI